MDFKELKHIKKIRSKVEKKEPLDSIEKLMSKLKNCCEDVVMRFAEKQGLNFEFFVGDNFTDVASFGSIYYFSFTDICYDLFTDQPKGQILIWLENYCHELSKDLSKEAKYINYYAYCKGLRYDDLKK